MLIVAAVQTTGLASLWLTEPTLVPRASIALAALALISFGWAAFAVVRLRAAWIVPALLICTLTQFPRASAADLRDVSEETMTAKDGSQFMLTKGVVRVPQWYANPDKGAPIELAFVRVRAAAAPSRVAHVFLAGGPGDSAIRVVLGLAKNGGASWAEIAPGDLIGIDQRGVGQSRPNLDSDLRFDFPLDVPGSPENMSARVLPVARVAAAQFAAQGVDLAAYNTRESADDIDTVRRELGYDKIVLWGRSYGTHLALETLRRHAQSIERVILISPLGPDHMYKLPLQVDRVLERLAARQNAPTLLADMREVMDSAQRAPVKVTLVHPKTQQPVTVALSAFDLQWLTANALADPRQLALVPLAYREMKAGDFKRMATLALIMRGSLGIESGMKQMMKISSGAGTARRARIEREARASVLGNAINFPVMYMEGAWPAADLGDEFRAPVRSNVPTLILVGELDARTPVENATEIAATLSNNQLEVIEGAAHEFDVFGSAPIREMLRKFLHGDRETH